MKLIAALGNPGEKYKTTRHNAGFLALDYILSTDDHFLAAKPSKDFKSELFTVDGENGKIVFMKPQTYMNDSGRALNVFCNFYKLDLSKDLLIIHDEVDLPFGTFRTVSDSSAAGHNGIKSIIAELGTQNFQRIRIGIETRASRGQLPTDAFVLQNFTDEELENLREEIFPQVKDEVIKFINS